MRKKKIPVLCPYWGEVINVGKLLVESKWANMSRRDRAKEKKRLKGLRKATMKPKTEGEEGSK
jgi:hypothetical protein